ncbi:penicillin-binding protein 1A [Acidobacteriota bacterium]
MRLLKAAVLLFLFALALSAGITAGYILVYSEDLPQISSLEEHRPSIISRIYDSEGEKIGEFALEKRIIVTEDQLPDHLIKAIIATEDQHFYEHPGIDLLGITRALYQNLKAGRVVEGGSTLTQQLAKLLFLTPERHLERKIKEAILAMRIESRYSKEEILTFYCNQIFLGHNRYGFDAASRYYFGKPVSELDLAESALLAGIPQRPSAYSPVRHLDAAVKRRNHVLERMALEGFVTREDADKAKRSPVVLKSWHEDELFEAPYFVEEVRKALAVRYGERRLYREGLHVYTTLDSNLQKAAQKALENGLRSLDKRQGWRGAQKNILDEGEVLDEFWDDTWDQTLTEGSVLRGLVTRASPKSAVVTIGSRKGVILLEDAKWTRTGGMDRILQRGDLVEVRVLAMPRGEGGFTLALEQEPLVEGGLVALDVKTGRILAMVGGYSFERSKFNRATQAYRQTGSAFKPIYYSAAFENGLTPADTLFDEPIALEDPHTKKVYSPENYSRGYYGLTTLRVALEKSRNPLSVQLLEKLGYSTSIDYARRLGITSNLYPYPSLALGVFETTLIEITSAYQAFANHGVQCPPYYITEIKDRDDHVLLTNHPQPRQVIREDTAFIITHVLTGVCQRGTASSARKLGLPLAGKTGTTDDFTDAWFIGYSPRIICGVWIGFDKKKTLGKKITGAAGALPVWKEFMKIAADGNDPGEFIRPANVDLVEVDYRTGLRAVSSCEKTIKEAFIRGTEPITFCSPTMHELVSLPYELQREALDRMELTQGRRTASSAYLH